MTDKDHSFTAGQDLAHALALLHQQSPTAQDIPAQLPTTGYGERATLDLLAPHVLGQAARLDRPDTLAHMDPPTPWITWASALWNARLNQNLLHPATAPFARTAEATVIDWLIPYFGMDGGHLCAGSTLANLTALWAAREVAGVKVVLASQAAHLSVAKAAHILGLNYVSIPTQRNGQIDDSHLSPDRLPANACLVLTAGSTATGVIDPLRLAGRAAWTHVDAAWAGPLRLSPSHAPRLDGIEQADSIAVSAHKWLFQPKESALILFRDTARANTALSFGGGYLATPNIGLQGSRGAAAVSLLATLLAWGQDGFAQRIARCMAMAERLAEAVDAHPALQLWGQPQSGVVVFRPLHMAAQALQQRLPEGMFSLCMLDEQPWLRSVAANPVADIAGIIATLSVAVDNRR